MKIFKIITYFMFLSLVGCDVQPIETEKRTAKAKDGNKAAAKDITKDKLPEDTKTEDTKKEEPKTQTEKPASEAGKQFFLASVTPAFKSACISCHAEPRFNPATPGPLSIYLYPDMKTFLTTGNSYKQNNLMKKIMNVTAHEGGDICSDSFEHEICAIVMEWWEKEFGTAPAEPANTDPVLASEIDRITTLGEVYGYAALSNDPTKLLELKFFVDETIDNGTAVGTTIANLSGYDNSIDGNHAFKFVLPAEFADGAEHQLYVYAKVEDEYVALQNSPKTYKAYTPKGAADYYTANVAPIMAASCNGCHPNQRTYTLDYENILDGTATNNLLYNKANAINNTNHNGGDSCNPACQTALQTWWNREFGTP